MVKKSQNLVNTVWTTPYTILVTGSNDLFVNYDSLVSKGVFDEKVEIQYVNNKYRIKLDLTNQICIKNLFYTFVIGCCILWARFSIWITYWLLLTPDGLFTLSPGYLSFLPMLDNSLLRFRSVYFSWFPVIYCSRTSGLISLIHSVIENY